VSDEQAPESLPFRDPALPLADRVNDLLGRLSTHDKIAMLHQHAPAVPRLELPSFHTGTEALHGVAWLGPATVFPQAIGLGATWDPGLVHEVAVAIATELRAFNHRDATVSLNAWAPVVNLLRDPRWGRNEEGYSEDALLTTRLATAFCRGMVGDHPHYLRVAPVLKHFLAYNNEDDRTTTSSSLRPRVLHEYDLRAFRGAVESGAVWGVMPAYNLVNGRPCHVSPLIETQLRSWTASSGHDVVVCSDAYAPSNLIQAQHYFDDHVSATAAALRAGVDSFTDHDAQSDITVGWLTAALDNGLIDIADVERAVRRLLAMRFSLGEFDGDRDPYRGTPWDVVNSPQHRELARRAAQAAVVLLHNTDGVLPMGISSGERVAVVGPLAETLFEDWYSGTLPYQVTVADGLRQAVEARGGSVSCSEGVDRITLRATSAAGYLCVPSAEPSGAMFIDESDGVAAAEPCLFDVFDWGEGVVTLRSAGTGRYVTVRDADLTLAATARQPGGWDVHETFRLEPAPEGGAVVLCAVLGRRYITLDPVTRVVRASASDPESAERWHCDVVRDGVECAVDAVSDADYAVVVLGNDPHINGRETQDRTSIALPPRQEALLREVAAACRRLVLVVMSSYPYAIDWAAEHVPAAVWTCHGGQEAGHGLASVLVGDCDPGGRLPQTWYRAGTPLPGRLDYDIINAGWTYQYFAGEPLYAFGHGLSYTRFAYGKLTVASPTVAPGSTVTGSVEVTNVGSRTGVEVVQIYSRKVGARYDAPRLQLQDFRRIELAVGERRLVEFDIDIAALGHWDVDLDRFVTDPGRYELLVGSSAAEISVTAQLVVIGQHPGPRRLAGRRVAAASFDDHRGARLVDASRECGDAVAPQVGASDCALVFRSADLGEGEGGTVTVAVAREEPGEACIELRIDDPASGPLLCAVQVPSTGDRYRYAVVECPLRGGSGVHDLYVVLRGQQRLASFELSRTSDEI